MVSQRIEFRLRARKRLSELQTLLVVLLNIGVVMPLLMFGILRPGPDDPALPTGARTACYVLGMGVILAQLAELMRPGIMSRRLLTCVVGADGVQGLDRFVPWSKVTLVVPIGDRDFRPPPRPYGARLNNGVAMGIEGEEPLVVWVKDPEELVIEAERLRAADRTRRLAPAPAPTGDGYRERTATPEMWVRVVLDASAESSARIDAFARLEVEQQEEVLEQLADAELRRDLTA